MVDFLCTLSSDRRNKLYKYVIELYSIALRKELFVTSVLIQEMIFAT